jgi:hypothetical protein
LRFGLSQNKNPASAGFLFWCVEVITLDDTGFGIYRLPGGQRLTNLLTR